MTILRDISIFWAMLHVVFLFIMLYRSRFTSRKIRVASYTAMGVLMLANGVGMVIYGMEVLGKVFLFTCSIPSFILLYVMGADKRFRFLLSFCLADT